MSDDTKSEGAAKLIADVAFVLLTYSIGH